MTDQQIKDQCARIMEEAPLAYLATHDAARGPQIRAMLNLRCAAQYPGLEHLFPSPRDRFLAYFSTNASSRKIGQLAANPQAAAYYCLPDRWHGFMIGGEIETVRDVALKDSVWQDGWEVYYPRGKTDPDYTVLLLRPRYIKGWLSPVAFEIALG